MNIVYVSFLLVGLVVAIYFAQKVIAYVVRKRLGEKQKLVAYRKRLHAVVSQLLARANEIDERSRFLASKPSNSWCKQLSDACNQLVGLSSALKELAEAKEEPVKAKNNLLRAVNVACTIESSLQQLEEKLQPAASIEGRIDGQ